jgi:multidrug resistance protein, MATE family
LVVLGSYLHDIRTMLRIAVPLALAELGWMGMGVVDAIMVGHLPDSASAIGAASLGSAAFYAFAIFGLGLMSGLDTLVSQAYGAGDMPAARRSLASGVVLALCATPMVAGLILACVPLMRRIDVPGSIPFVEALIWSLPPLMFYTVFRRYLQGIHFVAPITFALISANLINVLGNWALIF